MTSFREPQQRESVHRDDIVDPMIVPYMLHIYIHHQYVCLVRVDHNERTMYLYIVAVIVYTGITMTVVDSFSIVRLPYHRYMSYGKHRRTNLFDNIQECAEDAASSTGLLADAFTESAQSAIASTQNNSVYQPTEQIPSKYEAIVRNYNITEMFQPVSWLRNHHIQTIGGYIFRKLAKDNPHQHQYHFAYIPRHEPWYHTLPRMIEAFRRRPASTPNVDPTTSPPFWDRRERIHSPDGDFFHVDIKRSNDPNDAHETPPNSIVILLHGLQSNSQSPVCMEMATSILHHYRNNNCECHCINFRGCSGIPNDTVGGYHLGYTDDVKYYLQQLYQQYSSRNIPYPPIYVTGFSLGANVAVKCIGELGRQASELPYHIHAASVLCLPLDQVANAPVLAQPGINRLVYTQNLLQSLKKKCTEQYEQFYGSSNSGGGSDPTATPIYNYTKVMAAQTITEFDDSFIAPIYNFTDCWDYYTQTSSIHYLHNITVPTLVINSQDDPFFDNTIWPIHHAVEYGGTAPIKMIQTPHGGHLGYYFHETADSDERLVGTHTPDAMRIVPSWSAWETGKFLAHVHHSLYGHLDPHSESKL